MTLEQIVHFIHVLGWVCWLGADFGVFLASQYTKNNRFSVETRMEFLRFSLVLDKLPRVSVPIVFMSGVYLSNIYGVDLISLPMGILAGLVWLAVVLVTITYPPSTKPGKIALLSNLGIFVIVAVGMGGTALASLFGVSFFPGWLAVKWLAFAWIAVFSIGIDVTIKPAIGDYMRLEAEGASDEINASLSKNLNPVYATVLAVYAGTIVAAYFGINKVF